MPYMCAVGSLENVDNRNMIYIEKIGNGGFRYDSSLSSA